MMDTQVKTNRKFNLAVNRFLKLCRESINPNVSKKDVREMIVQHILTEDLFISIFDDADFHRENNIAKELIKVLKTFFTGKVKKDLLKNIHHYYNAIRSRVSNIESLDEKQKILKVVYEEFYKAYNPKGADRLGIVYTPNEIVDFMIEGADWLCIKHFGKSISDKGVEILDPATGTGTYVTSILQYIPKHKLKYKYKDEIHCNEISILPYYISNLNIEYTYMRLMGEFEPYELGCFVDTLDNIGFGYAGKQITLFDLTDENAIRIEEQNKRKISLIIGNPPYNANQIHYNDFNPNRSYPHIDKRIKETYVKYSTAQKTKVYDPYSRFYRWAMDRLDETQGGIIAFITNRSFIDSRTFDGFRKVIESIFQYAYIIDTKSDVVKNSQIAGTTHNVFGIRTGVAIMFLIKNGDAVNRCNIQYMALDDFMLKEDKLLWFKNTKLKSIFFETITPSRRHNWINLVDNDFEKLVKLESKNNQEKSIFKLSFNGIVTNRDEWVYDFNEGQLQKKIKYFIRKYNSVLGIHKYPTEIKWSDSLKNKAINSQGVEFDNSKIIDTSFRVFISKKLYAEQIFCDRLTGNHKQAFGENLKQTNRLINIYCVNSTHPLAVMASALPTDLGYLKKGNGGTLCLPEFTYNSDNEPVENITDWALELFQKSYNDETITKENLFHYIYSVLHYPNYCKKYELNLRRDFPRIPLYKGLHYWVNIGKELMDIHLNYMNIQPSNIKRIETSSSIKVPRPKLKVDKENGEIIIDTKTRLISVPPLVWEYKLGNRSAVEWVLDQYKEKKPRSEIIRNRFNEYSFLNQKEEVIDLLTRVCTISVQTIKIINQMPSKVENIDI